VEELKREGKIREYMTDFDTHEQYEYIPVLFLRAFSEVLRVGDSDKHDFEAFAKKMGMKLQEYGNWWTEEIAKNIAKMHNLGKIHTNLTPQNLTLDGRFVDNDTVKSLRPGIEVSFLTDITSALDSLSYFCAVSWASKVQEHDALFLKTYFENFRNIGENDFSFFANVLIQYMTEDSKRAISELFEKKFNKKLNWQ
jgi:hypothetical protein